MNIIRKLRAFSSTTRMLVALPVLAVVLSSGCSSMNHTDKGVLAGGGTGAVAGGLIGSASGNTGFGAAAGGIIGAITGGLIGNSVDEAKAEARAARAAIPPPPPLGFTDIVKMSIQQTSDDIIISQIRATGSVYYLSPQDIVWLRENSVSNGVIREMQATAQRPVRRIYSRAPVYERVHVVPEPPPPPGLSLGVGYTLYR